MALNEERGDLVQPPEGPGEDVAPPEQEARPGGLTPERLAGLLAYCKLTELAEDPEVAALIPVLYQAAVGYMENAGVARPEAGTPRAAQYDLCVNYLVLDAFERRNVTITGTIVADNPVFRRLINQLKWTESEVGL